MVFTTYRSLAARNALIALVGCAVVAVALLAPAPLAVKAILAISGAVAAVMGVWALASRRSITAILLFYVFRLIPIKDRRDPEVFQAYLEENGSPYEVPAKTAEKYGITLLDDYSDTYVIDNREGADGLVVFYIHGGGYWVRPYGIHFTMFHRMSKMLQAEFVMPIYPLAPAHTAQEANAMVMERYLHLVDEDGVDPANVVFMGDSAGAGLSMSLMLQLKERGLPLPREAVYFSPWVDASNSTPGMDEVTDPFLNLPNLTYGGEVYADDLEGGAKNPLVSPIYGDLRGLPKITAFGGTYDSLNLDAVRMAHKAQAEGFDYDIYVYPKMIHGYAGFFFTPESKYAMEQVENVLNGKPVTRAVRASEWKEQRRAHHK